MEVEGDSLYMIRISGQTAYVVHIVLVNLVDRHIETDVTSRGIAYILQDDIVGIAPDGIVPFPVTVQAQEDQICFWQVNGEGTVGNHIDDQETHFLCFNHKIPECFFTVPPKEGLASAEEQDPHTQIVERLHFLTDFIIGVNHSGDVIHRAMLALQIAFVSDDYRSKDRFLLSE